jgi:gliding motility-associated-like protein
LSTAESDTDEAPGCNGGNNNFVAAVDMIAGRSYALIINNFSNTGNGFSIEFGGTGTFLGPDADFNVAPQVICQGADITFSDLSNSVGGIDEWEWSFGIGANPATATGKGPHTVSYNTPGIKSIALTVTDKSGCIVTHVETITVLPPPNVDPEIIADYCGPDDATGGISLTPTGDATPYTYNWQGSGTFSPDNTLENIQQGSYSVIVKDANGCSKPFNFVVPEGLSLAAGLDPVTEPTCNGDSDGSISVSIEIANYPVTYDFGNGPQSDSVLSNIPAGTYTVHVVDNAGCEGTFNIVVNEFPPLLLGIDPLDISCYGAVDGSIDANPTGGAGGYTYLWSNGELTNPITDLNVGTYTVTVTDANGCMATATADIIEPPALELTLDITDVICHGDATGVVTMNAVGGTPPFEFSSNGVDFQSDPELGGLVAGVYEVVLRDSRGCTFSLEAEIDEPAPLVVEAGPDQTIDLGYSAEIKTVVTPLFRPVVLSWSPGESLDCDDCFNPTASPFLSTTYYVTATDETNCIALDSVTINVLLNRPIYIPNVFSPNGDGLNDFFIAFGGPAARRILQIKIFDRWGELVYDGRDLPLNEESLGWDGTFKGKVLNPAVFVYFAEIEFIDGAKVIYEGGVTILK